MTKENVKVRKMIEITRKAATKEIDLCVRNPINELDNERRIHTGRFIAIGFD